MTPPRRQPRPIDDPESGLALFVVLVVVMVLSVLVTQLSITTKIEERISEQHQGFLESSYSLQSIARRIASLIHEDWTADLEEVMGGGEEEGGDMSGLGAADPSGGGGQGASSQGAASNTPLDTMHEEWRHRQVEPLNEWQIEYRIVDGESRLSLQHIFWYVQIEDDPQNPKETDKTLWLAALRSSDPDADPEESTEADVVEAVTESDAPPVEAPPEIIQEFQLPSDERIEKTTFMLARLIEAIILYNADYGFPYFDSPSPDAAAEAIVEWTLERMRDESTRRIRSLEPLKDLEDVGWELFNGPPKPESDEDEENADFGDFGFDGMEGEFERFGGGYGDGSIPGYEEVDGGVALIPEPLGLKHVLTAYSTGRINLNTVRPELVTALLADIEEFEVAFDQVANVMDVWVNSYVFEEEGEESSDTTAEDEALAATEFNVFTAIEDLIGLQDNEDFEALIDMDLDFGLDVRSYDGEEASLQELIQRDLQPISVYASTYFIATITGRQRDQTIQGELVLVRDDQKVKVLSWREIPR